MRYYKKPNEVNIGDIAIDYNNEKSTVVKIVPVKEWESIASESTSGWLDANAILDSDFNLEEDWLIVVSGPYGMFDNSLANEVFLYDPSGVIVKYQALLLSTMIKRSTTNDGHLSKLYNRLVKEGDKYTLIITQYTLVEKDDTFYDRLETIKVYDDMRLVKHEFGLKIQTLIEINKWLGNILKAK